MNVRNAYRRHFITAVQLEALHLAKKLEYQREAIKELRKELEFLKSRQDKGHKWTYNTTNETMPDVRCFGIHYLD